MSHPCSGCSTYERKKDFLRIANDLETAQEVLREEAPEPIVVSALVLRLTDPRLPQNNRAAKAIDTFMQARKDGTPLLKATTVLRAAELAILRVEVTEWTQDPTIQTPVPDEASGPLNIGETTFNGAQFEKTYTCCTTGTMQTRTVHSTSSGIAQAAYRANLQD